MQGNQKTVWTPERKIDFRKLWDDGLSARQIANHFGDVTRNAVLGAAFRMGLAKRRPTTSTPRQKRAPRVKIRWRSFVSVESIPEDILPPPDFIGITFQETNHFTCMYPEGEGREMRFCGQQKREGSSFCAGHHRICYYKRSPNLRRLEKVA